MKSSIVRRILLATVLLCGQAQTTPAPATACQALGTVASTVAACGGTPVPTPTPVATPTPAATPTPVPAPTPAATGFTAQVPLVPNVLFQIDAAMSAATAALAAGVPGIQTDAHGVLAMTLPDGTHVTRGYGALALLSADADFAGKPAFRGAAAGFNNSYDGMVFPAAPGNTLEMAGQSFDLIAPIKVTAPGSNTLLQISNASSHLIVAGAGSKDCALHLEQNNGSAIGTEPSSALTACGQKQELEVLVNSQAGTISILRNNNLTFTTPAGTIGSLGPVTGIEMMNGFYGDLPYAVVSTGIGTIAQRSAEASRQAALYGITGLAVLSAGPAAAVPPATIDLTATFLSTVNNPTSDVLPVASPASTYAYGVQLAAGTTPFFDMTFGPGGTIPDGNALRAAVYMNYMAGNPNLTFGSPQDTGQSNNSTFHAVARHFAVGDSNDVHKVDANGLHLTSMCSQNRTNCSAGAVWAGMIRLPAEFQPGDSFQIVYRNHAGPHRWAPIWWYSGKQRTPGPGGDAFQGFGTPQSLLQPGANGREIEVDWSDNYPRAKITIGHEIEFGTPNIYGNIWGRAPQITYAANGASSTGSFLYPGDIYPDTLSIPEDSTAADVTMVGNWRGDGSNLLDLIINGQTVQTAYLEQNTAATYVGPDGLAHVLGEHMLIGGEAIPAGSPNATTAVDNDGIPDGWTLDVRSIIAKHGNVVNPDGLRANAGIVYPLPPAPPVATPLVGAAAAVTLGGTLFSWLNQETATVGGGGAAAIVISSPGKTDAGGNMLMTAFGVGTYRAKLRTGFATGNHPNAGLALATTGSSRTTLLMDILPNAAGSTAVVTRRAAFAVQSVDYSNAPETIGPAGTDFDAEVVNDGKTVTFGISATGAQGTWTVLTAQSLLELGNPDQIGPYIDMSNNAAGTLTVPAWTHTAAIDPQAAASFLSGGSGGASPVAPVSGMTQTFSYIPARDGLALLPHGSTSSSLEAGYAANAAANPAGIWQPRYIPQLSDPRGGTDVWSGNASWNFDPEFPFSNHYTPFAIDGAGNLRIRAQPVSALGFAAGEVPSNPNTSAPFTWASGILSSKNRFSQVGGCVQIVAQLPHSTGSWPAFYAMPFSETHPPERDTIEFMSQDPANTYRGNFISDGPTQHAQSIQTGSDLSAGMHSYSDCMTSTTLTRYFDGVQVGQLDISGLPESQQPFYLLICNQVGSHLPEWVPQPDSTTAPTLDLLIQSVSAWQFPPSPAVPGTH